MAKDVKSIFKGIKDAKVRYDALYQGPGHYLHRIDKVKLDENRKGIDFFAVEMTTLHVLDNADNHPGAHRVGDSPTWMTMRDKDQFVPEVKTFIANVLEEDLDTKSEDEILEMIAAIVDDSQPLAGTVVEVKARTITLQSGNPFTRVQFVREVHASELLEILTDDEKSRFYPGDQLEKMIEAEKKQAA